MKKKTLTLGSIVVILLLLAIYFILPSPQPEVVPSASLSEIPAYSGEPFVILEDNMPRFSQEDYVTESYEQYEDLDALNRCTYTMACIGRDLMPTEERGNIRRSSMLDSISFSVGILIVSGLDIAVFKSSVISSNRLSSFFATDARHSEFWHRHLVESVRLISTLRFIKPLQFGHLTGMSIWKMSACLSTFFWSHRLYFISWTVSYVPWSINAGYLSSPKYRLSSSKRIILDLFHPTTSGIYSICRSFSHLDNSSRDFPSVYA